MTDIVAVLRKNADDPKLCGVDAGRTDYCHVSHILDEAADEIERLRKIERTAIALRDDLLLRADIGTPEGDHSVQASATIWFNLCEALNND